MIDISTDFRQALDDVLNIVNRRDPITVARYGDGELALMQGREVGPRSQAYTIDRWSAPPTLTGLGSQLHSTLQHEWVYGIPCSCCNLAAKNDYLHVLNTNPLASLTYANLFINSNWPEFSRWLVSGIKESVFMVCNVNAQLDRLPFPVEWDVRVEDNCVHYFNVASNEIRREVEGMAMSDTCKSRLVLVAAGPMSNVIIDWMYRAWPHHRYLDVGSAIDFLIYDRVTRGYQVPENRYAQRVCVL